MLDLLSRVNPQQLAQAGRHAGAAAGDLATIRAILAAAYGVPPTDLEPPALGRVPFVSIVEFPDDPTAPDVIGPSYYGGREVRYSPQDGRTFRVEIESRTGRASLRGYVANLGDSPVLVRFLGLRDEWSDFLEVPDGATLSYTWATRAVDILAISGDAARAQVVAL